MKANPSRKTKATITHSLHDTKMKTEHLAKILKEPSVTFNDAAHTYQTANGELYTGCTTISSAWDKSFFLGPWHAKEAIEAAKKALPELSLALAGNDPKGAEAILDNCKGAAKRKGEEAKVNGTAAHDWIAAALDLKISGTGKMLPMPENEEAKNAVNAFIAWAKSHDVKWLASEEVVCSDTYRVAGKLDAVAVVDGLTYLIDFKTSSQISPDYLLQAAGYDLMLREMGLQVMGYLILRIPKDGTEAETLTITNQTDMAFFRETFLKQREAHKFYVLMESRFKNNGKMKVDEKVAPQIVDPEPFKEPKKEKKARKPRKKTKKEKKIKLK